jgi:hypothetical protein
MFQWRFAESESLRQAIARRIRSTYPLIRPLASNINDVGGLI